MPFDRKEYMKEYYEKNKEKLDKKNKDYRENNKEKIKERKKEQMKEYRQTENGKKIITICSWKKQGLKYDDYDELYDKYIIAENCEECEVKFEEENNKNQRCMDHDHTTGLFRNFLCKRCNLKRR
jgi:hypothetical protein